MSNLNVFLEGQIRELLSFHYNSSCQISNSVSKQGPKENLAYVLKEVKSPAQCFYFLSSLLEKGQPRLSKNMGEIYER